MSRGRIGGCEAPPCLRRVRTLEEAGYIAVEKTFKGKRPNTMLNLTPAGRDAFQAYRLKMKQFFDDLPE